MMYKQSSKLSSPRHVRGRLSLLAAALVSLAGQACNPSASPATTRPPIATAANASPANESLKTPEAAGAPETTSATTPNPNVQAGFYRLRVGNVSVTAVSDGTFPLDVSHGLALNAKPGEIDRLLSQNLQTSPIDASFNEFVIATEGRLSLVDTGAAANMGPTAGKIGSSLTSAGFRAEDITDIYLTHIHPDHAGGLVSRGIRAFPNATVHVDAADLAYWTDSARAAKATGMAATFFAAAKTALEPYIAAGKVKPFSGPTELFRGFSADPAYGHTPGHVVYTLEDGGQKLLFLGDTIHIPAVQFEDPRVAVAFDVDAPAAVATRERLLSEVATKGILVANNHIPFPGIGHVRREGAGYRWVAIPYVNDATQK